MINKRKLSSEKAFVEACKKNGLIYKKHEKGTQSDYVELVDEEGNCFHLKSDLSIKKCDLQEDNDYAATREVADERIRIRKGYKKTSYKVQKGFSIY